MQLIAIAVGGALGALLRYWMSNSVYRLLGREFPWGTLAVNVLGSFAMGLLFVYLVERAALAPVWRAALVIGLLGAFTTFSTFSIETLLLMEKGAYLKAIGNMTASLLLCMAAVWVGAKMGRHW